MNSLLIVVVVVMRCFCWWLKPWVILTIELEVNLCCSWRFSWKRGQMVIFVEMMFWFKFYMVLSLFWCLETFRQTLGSNLGLGDSKLGFWGWKMEFSRELSVIIHHGEWIYSSGQVALWHHALFRILASFPHISVLNWPLV